MGKSLIQLAENYITAVNFVFCLCFRIIQVIIINTLLIGVAQYCAVKSSTKRSEGKWKFYANCRVINFNVNDAEEPWHLVMYEIFIGGCVGEDGSNVTLKWRFWHKRVEFMVQRMRFSVFGLCRLACEWWIWVFRCGIMQSLPGELNAIDEKLNREVLDWIF
jgi:hypothetical protein